MSKEQIHTDIVIIGAGPAGLTAGIYAGSRSARHHHPRKGSSGWADRPNRRG